jgi:YggT family protein
MFVLANLVYAVALVLRILVELEIFAVIASALFSWLNPNYYGNFRMFFQAMSDLVERPLRKVFPFLRSGIVDYTPLVAILVLVFIDQFLVGSLFDLSYVIRAASGL